MARAAIFRAPPRRAPGNGEGRRPERGGEPGRERRAARGLGPRGPDACGGGGGGARAEAAGSPPAGSPGAPPGTESPSGAAVTRRPGAVGRAGRAGLPHGTEPPGPKGQHAAPSARPTPAGRGLFRRMWGTDPGWKRVCATNTGTVCGSQRPLALPFPSRPFPSLPRHFCARDVKQAGRVTRSYIRTREPWILSSCRTQTSLPGRNWVNRSYSVRFNKCLSGASRVPGILKGTQA